MKNFDEKELEKLTKLCRIRCSENEKKNLHRNLREILGYVEQLSEVNTEGVECCDHVFEFAENVMREDEVKNLLPREVFLANSPSHVGGMIRVPPVIAGKEG